MGATCWKTPADSVSMKIFVVSILIAFMACVYVADSRSIEAGSSEDETAQAGSRLKRSPGWSSGYSSCYNCGYSSGYSSSSYYRPSYSSYHRPSYNSYNNYNSYGHHHHGGGRGRNRPLRRLLRTKALLGTGVLIGSALARGK